MITRAFQRLQRALGVGKERFFVGNDLAGNSYYEKHLPNTAESRPRRFVNFQSNHNDPTMYRTHHLSPQWSAWLSFTRKYPPSIEELQADQLRLSHLRENVRRLELQDQARKQAQLEKANTAGDPPAGLPDLRESIDGVDDHAELNRKRKKISESPLAAFTLQPQTNPDQTWQPQSWNPQQITRK
ncbi:hypothetical protein PCANC_15228 [Puccinia coronata f. sp. avenae]|uniref:NADH dehydrogenase [ubiquinone] 1 alpha subcomplex subunit n=1 Tax=Puccinia coronata f. sp. avenae TaxID=200324 RepID=A0A2N5S1W5_9BASI|nr:hypothetical protein PCANC_26320 [Puccinia coronata f. sp. avenae]PLW18944.1 hypothetical protein PCASD_22736 [Puccinia coronata f. sp. avenae]PLW50013.1 hypothetical protein PCASD_01236 [Puccinia coronata f. sp. avenae]PLW51551.1 hypothetical protein PCANC_15228 [Puccinia coronata f. sp. avenae]